MQSSKSESGLVLDEPAQALENRKILSLERIKAVAKHLPATGNSSAMKQMHANGRSPHFRRPLTPFAHHGTRQPANFNLD